MVPFMKRCRFCIFVALVFCMLAPAGAAHAQKSSQPAGFEPYWLVNVSGGTSLFFGDLKQNNFWPATYGGQTEWRLGAGLMLGKQFSSFFGLRGQALYGQLSGIKSSLGRYFQDDYIEVNVNGTFNLNSLISGYNPNRKWNAYLVAGVGLTNYNSTLYDLSTNYAIGQRGYGYGHGLGGRTLEGDILGGIGITYKINNYWSINIESVQHAINSDKMDLLVQNSKYDMYNYTSVGISFKFGQKKHIKATKMEMKLPKPFVPNPAILAPVKTNEKQKGTSGNIPLQPPTKVQKSQAQAMQKAPKKKFEGPVRHLTPVRPIHEYRVQIRARYQKPVSLIYLSNHYHIAQNRIRTDMYNGYYIYTVGSFDTYQQARTECNILRTKNGVTDAFVVFFKNGRRMAKLPQQWKRKK